MSAKVKLMTHTPEPLSVIYTAFRQCYHQGFAGDMWEKLHNNEISQEKQGEFVRNIMSSGHESPLEHVSFTFAVSHASRALTHQLVRHRIASFSQQSQRYVDAKNFEFITPPAIAKNPVALEKFNNCMKDIANTYAELQTLLLEDNSSKSASNEDARFVLPQAVASNIVFTMNCRSLLNFFHHRCCTRAQWEIRSMAMQMLKICKEVLPEIFENAGAKCLQTKTCPEGKFSCGLFPVQDELKK